jgi:hypothetical protein
MGTPCHKNDIIDINKKIDDYTSESRADTTCFSKQSSNLSIYIPKRVGDKGQPCLTMIFQLISFDYPSMFLNLAITFSYILIVAALNS